MLLAKEIFFFAAIFVFLNGHTFGLEERNGEAMDDLRHASRRVNRRRIHEPAGDDRIARAKVSAFSDYVKREKERRKQRRQNRQRNRMGRRPIMPPRSTTTIPPRIIPSQVVTDIGRLAMDSATGETASVIKIVRFIFQTVKEMKVALFAS